MSLDLSGLIMLTAGSGALYSGWLLLCLSQQWPFAETLLIAAVGWWCQVVATELVLGWLRVLTPIWLGSVNLIVLAVLLVCALRRLSRSQLVLHGRAVHTTFDTIRSSPTLITLLCLLTVWIAWTVFLGLIFPPYASDEYYYHMPIVASIIQARHIGLIPSIIPWISAYPKHSELLVVWNSIFFHRDTFADLTMLPFALAGGLGTYAAARRLGSGLTGASLAGSVFLFAPTVLIQMKSTYNDVMIGALWAIGLCLVLPPRSSRYPGVYVTTLVSGAVAGLILGVKYSGPTYVAGLALMLGCHLVGRLGAKRSLPLLGLFLACVLLTGGYWYAFNLATFGNPLWPFTIRLGGAVLFAGNADAATMTGGDVSLQIVGSLPPWGRLLYAWLDRQDQFSVDSRLAGLGPLWIVIAVPSVIVWGIIAALQRRWVPCTLIAIHLMMLASIPLNWVPRYSLFLLALGGCAVGAIYELLLPPARRWLRILTVLLALFAIVNSVDHRFFSVQRIRTFVGLPERQRTGPRYDPGSFGPTYDWVSESVPDGSTIAYGNNIRFPYPLWGAAFERRVIAIPSIDPTRYVEELRAAGVRYVFVGLEGYQAAILTADPSVRRVFAGGDRWQVFEVD